METAGYIVRGGRCSPNLKKTQYVIGTEMGGSGHGRVSRSQRAPFLQKILPTFFKMPETFFTRPGLHTQPNTRPAGPPPSGQLDSPRGKYKGRREDLARLSFFT